jgi:membrane protein DedA with SNARE-associated domain
MHDLILSHVISGAGPFIYLIIFLGMIFEGDIFLLTTIFLVHEGDLSATAALIAIISGVFIGDILWYITGATLVSRLPFLRSIINMLTKKLTKPLHKRTFLTLFISKYTYGIHHALLLKAGHEKIPFKKYLNIILVSNTMWIIVIGSLGYFFSESFHAVRHLVKYGEIALLIGLILFFIIQHFLTLAFENQATE